MDGMARGDSFSAWPPEDMPVIVYGGRRVVTTPLLAKLYGTQELYIIKNFQRNIERFVPNKHFHKLEGTELKAFKDNITQSNVVQKQAKHLILWTERGAARHAKMLDTDKAWDVFEKLEDCYFNMADQRAAQGEPAPAPAPAAYTSPDFISLPYDNHPLRITRLAGGFWYGSSGVARALGWTDSAYVTKHLTGAAQVRVVPHKGRTLMVIDHDALLQVMEFAKPHLAARLTRWLGNVLRSNFGSDAPALPVPVDPLERVTGDARQLALDWYAGCQRAVLQVGARLPALDATTVQLAADAVAAQLVDGRRWELTFGRDGLPTLKGFKPGTVLLDMADADQLAQLLSELLPAEALPAVLDAGLKRLGTLALPSR
jgi:hypothetical protein